MNKTKKLFYIPGIISLIGIWSFYFSFKERFIQKRESYLSFVVPRDGNRHGLFSADIIVQQIASKNK